MINSAKLKGRIVAEGLTIGYIAGKMGISAYTLGKKISNKAQTTLKEANTIQNILHIPDKVLLMGDLMFPKPVKKKRPAVKMPDKKGYCAYCGTWGYTDWHHIKYRSQGGGNELDNLLEVCRMCHSAIHNGVISKEEVASVKRGDGL